MPQQFDIPGYAPGTWVIDTARSTISFQTKMLGFLAARGTFDEFEGTLSLAESPADSTVKAVITAASVNTKNARRDADLLKAGYLNAEAYPTISFTSTRLRQVGEGLVVEGDFTMFGVTRPLALRVVPQGFTAADGKGEVRLTASGQVSNKEVGVTKGAPFIRDLTDVELDIVAVRQD